MTKLRKIKGGRWLHRMKKFNRCSCWHPSETPPPHHHHHLSSTIAGTYQHPQTNPKSNILKNTILNHNTPSVIKLGFGFGLIRLHFAAKRIALYLCSAKSDKTRLLTESPVKYINIFVWYITCSIFLIFRLALRLNYLTNIYFLKTAFYSTC